MKNTILSFIGFGLVCVAMIVVTGNYVYSLPAEFFFIVAGLFHRQQTQLNRPKEKLD